MTNIRSASSVYIRYGYETAFQGGASAFALFGKRQNAGGLDVTNTQTALPQLDTPEIKDFLWNTFRGSVSVDYVLSNPWWLTAVLNDYYNTPTLSSGVYTYLWSSDPSVNTKIRQPKTLNLDIGERLDTAIHRSALGAITPTLSIKSSIDNPIEVNQSLQWGKESDLDTTLAGSLPSDSNFTPYNFVNGTLELPNSTTVANVQDFDINFDTGATLLWGHGSRFATDRYNKVLNMTGRMNLALKDKTFLQDITDMYNTGEKASLRLFITNGLTSSSLKSIELLFTGVGISTHSTNGILPAELLTEEIQFQCRSLAATAKNSTAPGSIFT